MFSTHERPEWAHRRGPGGPHEHRGEPGGPRRGARRRGGPFGGMDFGPPFGGPFGPGGPRGRGRGRGRGPEDEGPQDGPGPDGPGPDDRGPFPGPWGPGGPRGRRGGPGGRGGHGHGPGGRGRGRRSRGDVRLAILALLREESKHGYQIIQEISERSGGSWKPSPGSVYPTVSQLADEGLVHTEKESGRTVVHLTEEGRRFTEEHAAELDAVWSQVEAGADDGFAAAPPGGPRTGRCGRADRPGRQLRAGHAGDGHPRRGPAPALPAARGGRPRTRFRGRRRRRGPGRGPTDDGPEGPVAETS